VYSVTGLVNEDNLEGTLEREAGKDVGTYNIGIGSLNGGNNYTVAEFKAGTFTITPAELLIATENKSKVQGTANPVLTFAYTGLVAGDTPADLQTAPTASTVATSKSPIGTYDIK